MRSRLALIYGCVVLVILAGCGPKTPETAKVTGRITLAGVAVKTGTIMFYPEIGRPAVGSIQADGTYRLTTFANDDGALLGKHVVTIEATEIVGGANPKSFADEVKGLHPGELRIIVPLEYGDRTTSSLQATVEAKENVFDFDLKKTNPR